MTDDIMARLERILDYIIIHYLAKGNKVKVQNYSIYKKNLGLLSIVGVEKLIKELEAETEEMGITIREQVVFT